MVMDSMQGTLWKWTNYFSGWQPRWFVLNNGILSYYKTQEDVINGCKGSVKMAVCDVHVHHGDGARLDLIIPGEAHFYLKAATPHERQQWLVALGSSKACLTNGTPTGKNNEKLKEDIPEDTLKAKKSELRLYCDLLMQQVHSVKASVTENPASPDMQQMNDATSLLSATCDTFIKTLDDCMRLANANSSSTSLERSQSNIETSSTSPQSSHRPSLNRAASSPDTQAGARYSPLPTMSEDNSLTAS